MPHPSPKVLLLVILAAVLGLAGLAWLGQPPTDQELLANFAKAEDFLTGAKSLRGLPWWTPNFLQGTSLATTWSFMVSNIAMLSFSIPFGFLAGPKLAMLFCALAGSLGVYLFLSRYTEDEWCGFLGALLFLFSPALLVRLSDYEHFVVVCSLALLPYAFLGLLFFVRNPSSLSAVCAAAGYAAVMLAYGKTGLMAFPILVIFGLVELFKQPADQRPNFSQIGLAGLAFFALAVIPNLPALRETGFITFFDLNPFAAWQKTFSTKSALGWIDRDALLTRGMSAVYAPSTAGGTYLGIFGVVVIGLALFRNTLHETSLGRIARFFLALGLFAFWLSFGPSGVLGGHIAFLKYSITGPDFAPALGWLFLIIEVCVIFKLVPPVWPKSKVIAGVLAAIYLLVPGFRILELVPVYHNIRAPFDFYQVTGMLCVVFAAAILGRLFFARFSPGPVRSGLIAATAALILLDVSPYIRPLWHSPLSREVFSDFLAAQQYLKSSPVPGRVYAFSGRYFYLLTPYLSGRGLTSEAFNNYLQQSGMALMQSAAFTTSETLRAYIKVSGVSHLLVDKTDSDTPPEFKERLAKLLPVAFENENFLILENKDSLDQAFLAHDFIQTRENSADAAGCALAVVQYNFAVIQTLAKLGQSPGLRGQIVEGKVELGEDKQAEGLPFARVGKQSGNPYREIALEPSKAPGWLILTQAWHPDWAAYDGGNKLTIHQAFIGLPAVKTNGESSVTFRFEPPWWYPACVSTGVLAWLGAGLFCMVGMKGHQQKHHAQHPPSITMERNPILRPVVVIPTYNEAEGIITIIDIALKQLEALHILVVDDGSPDGTAERVRQHPLFETRVHLLSRSGKMGLGSAYKAGFTWAEEQGYDAVLEMDADLSHDPADIPRLVAALYEGADAAVGSRYYGGVRVLNWSESRLMLSLGASKFVRLVTGLPLTDATSGFKALRIQALQGLNWKRFTARGYGFQIELHYFLWKAGYRLVDVPIIFTERREGKTKMTAGIAVEALRRVLKLGVFGK